MCLDPRLVQLVPGLCPNYLKRGIEQLIPLYTQSETGGKYLKMLIFGAELGMLPRVLERATLDWPDADRTPATSSSESSRQCTHGALSALWGVFEHLPDSLDNLKTRQHIYTMCMLLAIGLCAD